MISRIEISGLRGFATEQSIDLAVPIGQVGSGMTVLVGANNSGKSTVLEALRALNQRRAPSFTQGRRNVRAGDYVSITVTSDKGGETQLCSLQKGTSETEYIQSNGSGASTDRIIVLPSRRAFNPFFGRNEMPRNQYMSHIIGFPAVRTSSIDQFGSRLFAAQKEKADFNGVLRRVLDPVPDWSIDQADSGQYFLKIATGTSSHSSEGLGEGLVSLFMIIDALYDSKAGETIAIDEPELSLHPSLQRKLSTLLCEYAIDRQVIVSTHSPYFVNLDTLKGGSTVVRAHLETSGCVLSQLSKATAKRIDGLLKNRNNPHILGLKAQEVFFLEGGIVLVEGQEDVVYYERVQNDLESYVDGQFYGWGVGGSGNMDVISQILSELGFKKVVGILDADKAHEVKPLQDAHPDYHYFAIPADDVRTKQKREIKAVEGLLDDKNKKVRSKYVSNLRSLFKDANQYLTN